MASTKQLLKQLESLSNPRNFQDAEVYHTLAKYYYSRHRTDDFYGHYENACFDWNHYENEDFIRTYETFVDWNYGYAMTAARKLTSNEWAQKVIAFKLLEKHIEEKYSRPFQAREHSIMVNYAHERYHPDLV